ncbi:Gp6-like protein [environmental Halophage eHP-25]|nr:Gp6-like protein [environmental Halophage eHP-25]
MANSNFDPVRLSGRVLRELRSNLVTDSIVNRNWEGEIEGPEDTVEILQLDALTVGDYSESSGISVDTEPSATSNQLSMDHQKYFAFIADMADNASKFMDLFQEQGLADLLKEAQQYVMGKYTGATHQVDLDQTTSTSANDVRDWLRQASIELDNAEVPAENRYALLRPQEYSLIEQDLFERDTELGDNVIRNGYQGMYQGFEIYKAPDSYFTNTGSSPSYDHALAGHRVAITYADAVLNTRVNPSTDYFGDQVDGLHVGGAKVVEPDALVDLRVQVA